MSRHFTRKDVEAYAMKLQDSRYNTVEIQSISVSCDTPVPVWVVKYDAVSYGPLSHTEFRVPLTTLITECGDASRPCLQFIFDREIPPDCADTIEAEDAAIKAAWSK